MKNRLTAREACIIYLLCQFFLEKSRLNMYPIYKIHISYGKIIPMLFSYRNDHLILQKFRKYYCIPFESQNNLTCNTSFSLQNKLDWTD